jgi:hypothetical protein
MPIMQKLCVLLGYFAYIYADEEFSANQYSGVLVNVEHLNSSPGILVSSRCKGKQHLTYLLHSNLMT